jgi:predicted O-methyltransferase YrrM
MNLFNRYTWNRPRLLNLMHTVGLAEPSSQTIESEFDVIKKYARGKRSAVEIGTYQGVSAAIIARQLDPAGRIYCVDPWFQIGGKENHLLTIAKRHFKRMGVFDKVVLCQGVVTEVKNMLPNRIDFAFIDGDHTYEGLKTDWEILAPRLEIGGVICLHDTTVPVEQKWREFGSCKYFKDSIVVDSAFKVVDSAYSLNAVQRVA